MLQFFFIHLFENSIEILLRFFFKSRFHACSYQLIWKAVTRRSLEAAESKRGSRGLMTSNATNWGPLDVRHIPICIFCVRIVNDCSRGTERRCTNQAANRNLPSKSNPFEFPEEGRGVVVAVSGIADVNEVYSSLIWGSTLILTAARRWRIILRLVIIESRVTRGEDRESGGLTFVKPRAPRERGKKRR